MHMFLFYVLQKKSWNKLCLEPHDTYVLFRIFFSPVNNKRFYFQSGGPLKKICYYQWQVKQVPDKQQVPDKWRDACKLYEFLKFDADSYNN